MTKAFDVARWEGAFEAKKNETVLSLATALPDIMANVPETKKLIILVDIVGFSQDTTREQVRKIYLFQRYLTAQVISSKVSFQKKVKVSHFERRAEAT